MKNEPLKSRRAISKVLCSLGFLFFFAVPVFAGIDDPTLNLTQSFFQYGSTDATVDVTCGRSAEAVFFWEVRPHAGEWDNATYDGITAVQHSNWHITGFVAGTTYDYAIQCHDGANWATNPAEGYWTATTAFALSDLAVTWSDYGQATFTWTANATADGIVWYGKSPSVTNAELGPVTGGTHSVQVTMDGNTLYYYKVCSHKYGGGAQCTAVQSFTTGGTVWEFGPPFGAAGGGGGGGSWGDASTDYTAPTCRIFRIVDTDATGDGVACFVQWAGWLILPSDYSWDKMRFLYDTVSTKRPWSYVWSAFENLTLVLDATSSTCPTWLVWQGSGSQSDASLDMCSKLTTVAGFVDSSWWQALAVAAVAVGTLMATYKLVMNAL